jgi:hypothetical protein
MNIKNQTSSRELTPLRLLIWLGIAACLWILGSLLIPRAHYFLAYGDSVVFWAPGQLLLDHQDPYDERLVAQKMEEIGRPVDPNDPMPLPLMVYPPWVFLVLLPFGWLPFPLFRLTWLIAQIAAILLAADATWTYYHKGHSGRLWAWMLALAFAPTVRTISIGNPVPFMAAALAVLVIALESPVQSWKKDLMAGGMAALLMIKPQLLYLFIFAMVLWSLKHRRWVILASFAITITLGTVLAALFNPQIVQSYITAMIQHPVAARMTPAVGSLLRQVFGPQVTWLQVLPSFVGLIWFLFYWFRNKDKWVWHTASPLLVTISLLTVAYAWTYDMVLLVLPLMFAFEKLSRIIEKRIFWIFTALYVVLDILVFVFYIRSNEFYLFWLPTAFTIWYLASISNQQNHVIASAAT